jgi:outer membrane receptor protein involved in Fe transport
VQKVRSYPWRALALSLGVGTLAIMPAEAQTGPAAATRPSEDQGLQEVVVSATKRSEDAQNVGLSLTALTATQLESKGVEQFFDYGTAIPNLSFGVGAADGSLAARGVALRGIQGANTTGFYIDDTPVLETLDPHIVDVARIEVLRGPQGTLYGAESMGGTVRIITAQPDPSAFSAQVHVGTSDTQHGSWNQVVEGSVNVPLVSNVLALRASTFYQFDDGYFDKAIGPETAPPTSVLHDVGSMKYYGGQIALRYQPVEALAITPRIMYQRTDQDGVPYARDSASNLLQRQVFDIGEGGSDKWWLASLTLNYTVPFGSFVSSTAYFKRNTFEIEDDTDVLQLDLGLATPIPSPITREIDLSRFAQELRFASTFAGPFQLIVGGFYSASTRPRDYEWTGEGLGAATGTSSDLALAFIDSRHAGEYAAFGDASYDILSNLKATVGVRWFRDTATFNQFTNGLFFGGVPSIYTSAPTSEKGFTPKYLLEYQATPQLLAYASAAKGFREGGNNIALPPGPPPTGCDADLANIGVTASQISTFKSDSLWNYEVGFKSTFLDRRFTLNVAGFVINWDKIQQLVSLPMCGYGFTGNSGAARSSGFELEFSGRPIPELTLGLGLGYDDAHITQQGLDSPQKVGDPVYQVPGITIASNAEYERHVRPNWSGFGRVDFSHSGGSFSANNAQLNPLYRPAYSLVDLRLGVRNDRYEIAAFVKNLANERANLGDAIMIGAQVPGQPHFVINAPRTAGVEARMKFD